MAQDAVDKVAQQAQMVAMACGPKGMVVAAAISIADSIYDAYKDANPDQVLSSWSEMQAFQDLADDVQTDLLIQSVADKNGAVGSTLEHTKLINKDLAEWSTSNIKESDIVGWETDAASGSITDTIGYWEQNFSPGTAQQVQFLAGFLAARVAYHKFCTGVLKLRARSLNRGEDVAYLYLGSQVRNALTQSLQQTIDYAEPPIKKLLASIDPETAWGLVDNANGCSATSPGSREPFYSDFSEQVRKLREAAFTNEVRFNSRQEYFDAGVAADIASFATTLADTISTRDAFRNSPVPTVTAGNLPANQSLGARQPNTLRVLFEYPVSQGAGGDSPVPGPVFGDGPIATQNVAVEVVGAKDATTYFQFPGTGHAANSASDALSKAGVLGQVNAELVQAYDARFGNGQHAIDSKAAKPPHVTAALAAPLVSGSGPIGRKTAALLFVGMDKAFFELPSVPHSKAVVSAARPSYDDLFAQIADWNATKPVPISALRLSLVSEQDLSGDMPSAYISAALVGVVLDAAIDAMVASPQHLGDLTLLVPINAAPGGWLRKAAFDEAAKAHKATVLNAGFDLPTN